jgi:hypothetical protein
MSDLRIDVGNVSIHVQGDYVLEVENGGSIRISSTSKYEDIKPLNKPSIPEDTKPVNKDPHYDLDTLRTGSQSLYGLVEIWKKNFALDGAEQPNRMEALRQAMISNGDEIITFLKYTKGLTNGIMELFPPMPDANEIQIVDHAKFNRKIACNIAQVSSVSMPELCEFLEPHANYLKQEFWW